MKQIKLISAVCVAVLAFTAFAGCKSKQTTRNVTTQPTNHTVSSCISDAEQSGEETTAEPQYESSIIVETTDRFMQESTQQTTHTTFNDTYSESSYQEDQSIIQHNEYYKQQSWQNTESVDDGVRETVAQESAIADPSGQNSQADTPTLQDSEQSNDDINESSISYVLSSTDDSTSHIYEDPIIQELSGIEDSSTDGDSGKSSLATGDDAVSLWAITTTACTLSNDMIIDSDTYLRVLENDAEKDTCVIQWYDGSTEVLKESIRVFEIPKEKEEYILLKRTAGVITNR